MGCKTMWSHIIYMTCNTENVQHESPTAAVDGADGAGGVMLELHCTEQLNPEHTASNLKYVALH